MTTINQSSVIQDFIKTCSNENGDNGLGVFVKQTKDRIIYYSNDNDDDKEDGDACLLLSREVNGIIVDKKTSEIVCRCLPKFYGQDDLVKDIKQSDANTQYIVELCDDGTVVKLYNFKGKWITSTKKCIDAKKSFWSNASNSFDDMFWDIFSPDQIELLDPEYTYIFVLLHTSNRIVIEYKTSVLKFLVKIHNKTGKEYYISPFTDDLIHEPTMIEDLPPFENKELKEYSFNKSLDLVKYNPCSVEAVLEEYIKKQAELYDENFRGLLIKKLDEYNGQYFTTSFLVDFPRFTSIQKLRGNCPNIRSRFIELWKQNNQQELINNYPEYNELFNQTSQILDDLVSILYMIYIDTHKKYLYKITNQDYHFIFIKRLHKYIKKNNLTLARQVVHDFIKTLSRNDLLKYIQDATNALSLGH